MEEIVFPFNHDVPDVGNFHYKLLTQPLMRDGEVVGDQPTIEQSRQLLADNLISLPWEGLALSQDEPAIGTQFVGF